MISASAWNNGRHHRSGAWYGLKIPIADRDRFFRREWGTVQLLLPRRDDPVIVNIDKASFWTDQCGELINAKL
jgi:hypothetical protein